MRCGLRRRRSRHPVLRSDRAGSLSLAHAAVCDTPRPENRAEISAEEFGSCQLSVGLSGLCRSPMMPGCRAPIGSSGRCSKNHDELSCCSAPLHVGMGVTDVVQVVDPVDGGRRPGGRNVVEEVPVAALNAWRAVRGETPGACSPGSGPARSASNHSRETSWHACSAPGPRPPDSTAPASPPIPCAPDIPLPPLWRDAARPDRGPDPAQGPDRPRQPLHPTPRGPRQDLEQAPRTVITACGRPQST